MHDLKAAAVQYEHADGDKAANFEKIQAFVTQASARHVDLISFPECCITGYWYLRNLSRKDLAALAEPVPTGPSSQKLMEMSRATGMIIGAGLIEIAADGALYNSFVVAMPDGSFACHRKIHCFISEHCASGSEVTVFDTPHGVKVGVLICYDNNIIENVRLTALQGAEVLLAPHQTGGCDSPDPHCMGLVDRQLWDNRQADPAAIEAELRGEKGRGWLMRWLPSRAHDSGLYVVFSNGIGRDDNELRTGNAMIIDCYGRLLAETWKAGDDMVIADLDGSLLAGSTGRRWLRTRRPDLYTPLAVRTGLEVDTRVSRFDKQGV